MTASSRTWLVPTETSGVSVAQTSSLPAMFDFSPFAGDPDIASAAERQRPAVLDHGVRSSYAPPGGTVTAGAGTRARPSADRTRQAAPAGTATVSMTRTPRRSTRR